MIPVWLLAVVASAPFLVQLEKLWLGRRLGPFPGHRLRMLFHSTCVYVAILLLQNVCAQAATGSFSNAPGAVSAHGLCASALNPSGPHTEQWLMSQADCESNCLADPSCTAYEWATVGTDSFGYSRCELQSGNVDSIRPSVNHICQVKSSSSKRLFDTHNRLITENSSRSKRHPYPTPPSVHSR